MFDRLETAPGLSPDPGAEFQYRCLPRGEARGSRDRDYLVVARAGLSSGGAMAVALAVAGLAYGETSAAVARECPLPPLCPGFLNETVRRAEPKLRALPALARLMERSQATERPVPLLVMQSTRDRVVRIENARMLRDVWLARHGGRLAERRLSLPEAVAEHCSYRDAGGRTMVETLFYEGRAEDPSITGRATRTCRPSPRPTGPQRQPLYWISSAGTASDKPGLYECCIATYLVALQEAVSRWTYRAR